MKQRRNAPVRKPPWLHEVTLARPVLAVVFCLAAGSASAQTFYLHASAGAAYHGLDCRRSVNCDRSDVGWRIGAGYRIARNWAAEVNYVDFGEATANSASGTTRIRSSGIGIGAAFVSAPESTLVWAARAGVLAMNSDLSQGGVSSSNHHVPLYIGGTIGYRVNRNLAVELSLTQSSTRADIAGVRENKGVAVMTAGLTATF